MLSILGSQLAFRCGPGLFIPRTTRLLPCQGAPAAVQGQRRSTLGPRDLVVSCSAATTLAKKTFEFSITSSLKAREGGGGSWQWWHAAAPLRPPASQAAAAPDAWGSSHLPRAAPCATNTRAGPQRRHPGAVPAQQGASGHAGGAGDQGRGMNSYCRRSPRAFAFLALQRLPQVDGSGAAHAPARPPASQVRMLCLPIDILAHHVTQGNTVGVGG